MVMLIGLVTIVALVWLLAWALTGESDAQRRHSGGMKDLPRGAVASEAGESLKRAA